MSTAAQQGRASLNASGRTFSIQNIAKTVVPPAAPPDAQTIARTRTRALQQAARKIEDFTHVDWKTVCQDLAVDPEKGLTSAEAAIRLERQGPNELEKEPPTPLWKLFLEQFSDILVMVLCVACIVALALQDFKSGSSILVVVIINASIGAWQNYKAAGDLDALSKLAADKCKVLRDGQIAVIEAKNLVPGDIAVLELGDKVPGDLRLIFSVDLSSDEAALTGESIEVKKDALYVEHIEEALPAVQETNETVPPEKDTKKKDEKKEESHLSSKNMVFMGCTIKDGRGRGVVVKTGMQTKMGHVASLLNNTEQGETPLQQKMEKLGKFLGIASLILGLIVFVVSAATGKGVDSGSNPWVQRILLVVSLVVAVVPEGLLVAITICLALGMQRMSKKGALIRNLHSVETLGSASVICSDKTGTLTKGAMTAVRCWIDGHVWKITGTGYDPVGTFEKIEGPEAKDDQKSSEEPYKLLFVAASLASNSRMQKNEEKKTWEATGNSSEKPLVVAGAKIGLDADQLASQYPRVKENPFNSARKMMSVFIHNAAESSFPTTAKRLALVKGAPNVVLEKCNGVLTADHHVRDLSQKDRDNILSKIDEFSEKAFRVLAIAYRPFEHDPKDLDPDTLETDLVLIGLVASIDPEREEVVPSISQCYDAGIRVVMITGDYVKTARAIAINIKLIPEDAPAEASVDCAVIRDWGDELADIKRRVKEDPKLKKELQPRVEELEKKVDEVTKTADVYARAKPVDKITIVESLQRQGNICSMTGDGVNDAPALKQANIGVAMGITGTATAQGAADMILTDDDFCSIVKAVEEGRTIYSNISKFIYYLLSCNVSEAFFILISVIIGYPSPLTPVQILYLNVTTDVAPALALAVEATEPGTMFEGPRKPDEPLLSKLMLNGIVIHNIVLTSLCVFSYALGLDIYLKTWAPQEPDVYNTFPEEVMKARTIAILVIVFAELIRGFSARSMRESVFRMGFLSNKSMIYSVFGSIALTLFVWAVPGLNSFFYMTYIDGKGWAIVLISSIIPFVVEELVKVYYRYSGFGLRQKVERYQRKN